MSPLGPAELSDTVDRIGEAQRPDGMLPWYPGGHGDPWDHVEAAMALTLGGRMTEAQRAYEWLVRNQEADGSWCNHFLDGVVLDAMRDTNVSAYVATGAWHHYLATADSGFLDAMFPVVEAAVSFVLSLQQPGGEVLWCVEPDGRPGGYALLTASSSIYFSLRCAIASAEALDRPRPDWELAAGRLAHALACRPHAFAPKHRFAMDWYYPVLCGAVGGEEARARVGEGWATFVMEGLGVRCVSDQPWVTAAETAECAIALQACGLTGEAALVLEWTHRLRHHDGSYWTGRVDPDATYFPCGERSTYSAAAVVLAHHTLSGPGPAAALFRPESLPRGLVLGRPLASSGSGPDPAQHL